jgi:purine-binding chemotaxis protein CheW
VSEVTQYCTFTLEGQLYGVEVKHVQEVIRPQMTTKVPLARSVVEGLINLRGQIVTAIDLRRRIGLSPCNRNAMNIVVRQGDETFSLLVDEIGEVLDLSIGAYEPAPSTMKGPAKEIVRGTYKLERRLLMVLDLDRVFEVQARP